jgi:hypothetical protein
MENKKLIAEAVRVICQAFTFPSTPIINNHGDNPEISHETLLGLKNLAEAFNLEDEQGKPDESSPPSLINLYNAAQQVETDKELRELRVFAETLGDGYILCEWVLYESVSSLSLIYSLSRYLNRLRSKRLTKPVKHDPRVVSSDIILDACLDNLEQFLSACIPLGVSEDDLFKPRDFAIANNVSLARVATTIIAVSKHKRRRGRRSLTVADASAHFLPVLRQESLREW